MHQNMHCIQIGNNPVEKKTPPQMLIIYSIQYYLHFSDLATFTHKLIIAAIPMGFHIKKYNAIISWLLLTFFVAWPLQ